MALMSLSVFNAAILILWPSPLPSNNINKSYIVANCFTGGGNQSTRENQQPESFMNRTSNKVLIFEIFVDLTVWSEDLFISNTKAGSKEVGFREVSLLIRYYNIFISWHVPVCNRYIT